MQKTGAPPDVRGIEFDLAEVPRELYEIAQVLAGIPAWDGRSVAQELYERRVAERRERRKVPEWFSAQDLLAEPWEREAAQVV